MIADGRESWFRELYEQLPDPPRRCPVRMDGAPDGQCVEPLTRRGRCPVHGLVGDDERGEP